MEGRCLRNHPKCPHSIHPTRCAPLQRAVGSEPLQALQPMGQSQSPALKDGCCLGPSFGLCEDSRESCLHLPSASSDNGGTTAVTSLQTAVITIVVVRPLTKWALSSLGCNLLSKIVSFVTYFLSLWSISPMGQGWSRRWRGPRLSNWNLSPVDR